jgi:hypothetical protein
MEDKPKNLSRMKKADLWNLLSGTQQNRLGAKASKAQIIEVLKEREISTAGIDEKDAIDIVLKNGIMYRLDTHVWWGKSTRMKDDEIEAKGGRAVSKNILAGMKTLVDPEGLAYFRSAIGYSKRWLERWGFPFLNLRGVFWVPKAFIPATEKRLRKWKATFDETADEYVLDYPAEIERWKEKLAEEGIEDLHNPDVYPTPEDLRSRLQFNWTKFAISLPPSEAGVLTDKEYKEALERHKREAKEFLDSTVTVIAQKFAKMVSTLQKSMASGKGVKQKTLDNMREFVATFDVMNITKNDDLERLVRRAGELLGDVGKDDLKASDELKEEIGKGIDNIVTDFSKVKDERITRALEF